jgi:molybdopterin-guanine dinucleotide biosynthesis protein A
VSEASPAAGILLAGGAGSRLGGVDKPALTVAGSALIERALAALGDVPVVVVGPKRTLSRAVLATREDPPGAGPAAALAAGIDALRGRVEPAALVAVLATDLPAVSAATVSRLARAVEDSGRAAGAVLVDSADREQLLLGVWRYRDLLTALAGRPSWVGASVRAFLAPMDRVRVPAVGDESADIDTPEQLTRWQAE